MIALACTAATTLAGTKEWRKHRDAARAAIQRNDFEGAVLSYDFALDEAQKSFKGADMRYLETVLEAGDLLNRRRNFEATAEAISSALTRMTKPKPGESLYKAALLAMLGDTRLFQAKSAEAEEAYRAALEICRKSVGARHPIAGTAHRGLAALAVERKDFEKAVESLQEALSIARSPELYQFESSQLASMYLRRSDPAAEASVLNMLGTVYANREKHAEAAESYQESIKTIERYAGKKSPELSAVLQNLARTQIAQRSFGEAEDTLLRALAIDETSVGGALSFRVSALVLARLYYERQDGRTIGDMMARLQAGGEGKPSSEAILPICKTVVEAHLELDEARGFELIETVLASEGKGWASSTEFFRFLYHAGKLAQSHTNDPAAEKYFQRYLAYAAKQGEVDASGLEANKALVTIYSAQERWAEAEAACSRQVAFMRKLFGDTDSRVANALDDKAAAVEKSGRTDEGTALRAEANRIRAAALLGK